MTPKTLPGSSDATRLSHDELSRLAGMSDVGAFGKWWRRSSTLVYPFGTILIGLAAIEVWVRALDVPQYTMPKPTVVFQTLVERYPMLVEHTWPTLQAIAGGFLLSVVVGIPLAILISASRFFEQVLYPILVVSQTVPKLAIAPLLVIWFGFGLTPKVLVAFLIAFFPITIYTVVGLRSVSPELIDLARSMQTTSFDMFRKFRLPYALPHVFGGLKVAITLAVIGAVVGEFVGSDAGLGYLILVSSGQLQTPLLFSAVFFLVVIGISAFVAVYIMERMMIPWHTSVRKGGAGKGGA